MQKPTSKNTKNEILDAYEEILQELNKTKSNKSDQQKIQANNNIVEQSTSQNSKDIIHQIATLKLQVNQSLEDLGKDLLAEREKLAYLQKSIELQESHLKAVHDITTNANSLEALLLAQQRKKEEFEEWISSAKDKFTLEMSEKKTLWNKEQQEHELAQKEKKDLQKKEWQRLEEEYNYKQKISKQQDEDQYKQNKLCQERELAEKVKIVEFECVLRESAILAKEQELSELRKYKDESDKILKEIIESTKKQLKQELEQNFKFESSIKNKEADSEIALLKQNIKFLESKVGDQDKILLLLNKQLMESQLQSQDLATKVIEGNARINDTKNKNALTHENHPSKTVL
jgi:hypothetical protein